MVWSVAEVLMRALLSLFLVLALAGDMRAQPVAASPVRHVLLISIDGLRPDAMIEGDTPVLKQLMKRGAYSLTAQTVFPSITLPSHVSMVTGVGPEKHEVLWNEWNP